MALKVPNACAVHRLETKANQQVIWDSLVSEHAPFRYNDPHGKQVGGDALFHYIPNGVPGIETRLPLLFFEGVGKGRIDLKIVAFH